MKFGVETQGGKACMLWTGFKSFYEGISGRYYRFDHVKRCWYLDVNAFRKRLDDIDEEDFDGMNSDNGNDDSPIAPWTPPRRIIREYDPSKNQCEENEIDMLEDIHCGMEDRNELSSDSSPPSATTPRMTAWTFSQSAVRGRNMILLRRRQPKLAKHQLRRDRYNDEQSPLHANHNGQYEVLAEFAGDASNATENPPQRAPRITNQPPPMFFLGSGIGRTTETPQAEPDPFI